MGATQCRYDISDTYSKVFTDSIVAYLEYCLKYSIRKQLSGSYPNFVTHLTISWAGVPRRKK
jgi:hypothetical protein